VTAADVQVKGMLANAPQSPSWTVCRRFESCWGHQVSLFRLPGLSCPLRARSPRRARVQVLRNLSVPAIDGTVVVTSRLIS